MPARKDFDAQGSIADAIPHNPAKRRYPCFAEGCPMPGTLFPDSQSSGVCVYHYAVHPSDIPRVTQVLRDWNCIAYEAHEARRVHCNSETATDLKVIRERFETAVERLRPLVAGSGWGNEFEPQPGEEYHAWGVRLEAFLGGRVTQALSIRHVRRAA